MLQRQDFNKNAGLSSSRERMIHARDKSHEQRKPKKKRKFDPIGCRMSFERMFSKILQPRPECKSCTFIPANIEKTNFWTIICYPLSRADYSKPLIPEDISHPTQVSDQQGTSADEYVFSNGTSMSLLHGNNLFSQQPEDCQATRSHGLVHGPVPEERNASPNTEQNIKRRFMKPPRYPEYTRHDQRLKSFARWWKQQPDPTTLSNAGFFFTNQDDLVRCYQCGIGLKDFSSNDNPLHEHVKHSSECLYLQEYLGNEMLSNIKQKVKSEDFQFSSNEASKYRHPEYKSYSVRLSSFDKWPSSLMQKPEQLAGAGLYYTGFNDHVRCFACDGGLRKWDPEDDPWTEHCRWFPECPFVIKEKGEDYVRLVQTVTANEIRKRLDTERDPAKTSTDNDILSQLAHLSLKSEEQKTRINNEYRETCLEMGYKEKDIEIAAIKLANKGNIKPTIEDIIDAIDNEKDIKDQTGIPEPGTLKEENIRLKSMLYCMACKVNPVNSLFLPCTHHTMCMTCAEHRTVCPVCNRQIGQKIKTFLV